MTINIYISAIWAAAQAAATPSDALNVCETLAAAVIAPAIVATAAAATASAAAVAVAVAAAMAAAVATTNMPFS